MFSEGHKIEIRFGSGIAVDGTWYAVKVRSWSACGLAVTATNTMLSLSLSLSAGLEESEPTPWCMATQYLWDMSVQLGSCANRRDNNSSMRV